MKIRDRDALVRRLALGGVVVSATVLSYSTLHHRALAIGIPEWSAWFYPVLYDAFILGASRTWQNQTLTDPTRSLAKKATIGGIIAAVVAFIVEFAPKGLPAVLGALMIPAVMATALVLTSRAAADRKVTPEKPAAPRKVRTRVDVPAEPAKPAETATEPAPTIPTKQLDEIPTETFEPTDKRAWIHAQLDQGVELTGAMIDKKFGGRNGARTLKSVQTERESRNGHNILEEVKA